MYVYVCMYEAPDTNQRTTELDWHFGTMSETISAPAAAARRRYGAPASAPKAVGINEKVKDTSSMGVVQFSTSTYYTEEDEDFLEMDVVRIGPVDTPCTVEFATMDGTGKAGVHYTARSGKLEFAPGETSKVVSVPIADTSQWNATLEFRAELKSPANCIVEEPLNTCRIWIIDLDCFPSSSIEHDSSRLLLLSEFYKRCWTLPVVRKGGKKMLLIDLLHNVFFVWQLVLNVYLVDNVLGDVVSSSEVYLEHVEMAVLLGGLNFLPLVILNVLDLNKCWYGVGGAARKDLQVNLLRKYLNYTESARLRVGTSGFIEAINRHVVEVVDGGFMQLFNAAAHLGKLVMLLLWSLSSGRSRLLVRHRVHRRTAVVPWLGAAPSPLPPEM